MAVGELARFLRARRNQVTPEEAGIKVGPGWRRTPGLRREELASLAGVSIDYYRRLEQGKESRPSPAVVDAIAGALHLGEIEHEHLHDLVTRAGRRPQPVPARQGVSPGVALMLERLRPYPARVLSRTMDVLASNVGGLRVLPGIESWPADRHNVARYVFLHPAARDLYADRTSVVVGCVARLRALYAIESADPDLARLVDELQAGSEEFARLWERYEIRPYSQGSKVMHHPDVGTITLNVQSMQIDGMPGHRMVVYYAEPGTPDHDAMVLLDRPAQEPAARPEG